MLEFDIGMTLTTCQDQTVPKEDFPRKAQGPDNRPLLPLFSRAYGGIV